MIRLAARILGGALALACPASISLAQSGGGDGVRPLAVEDIVSTAAFGRASISPDGRWAVYEKRGPYDSAPRYDLGPRSQWAITDLWRLDLEAPEPRPERLLPGEPAGLVRGPWSPAGDRMLVQRLRDGRLEFGVVEAAERAVRWTGLVPDMPQTGAAAEWLPDGRLALLTQAEGAPPWLLRYYGGVTLGTTAAWERTAVGQAPSRTILDAAGGVAEAREAPPSQALVLLDPDSGAVRELARGRLRDFSVSPDGRTIAVLEAGEAVAARPETVAQMDVPNRQRLRLVEVAGGVSRALDDGWDVAPHLLRWSPDGAALLVWARRDGRAWPEGDLLRVGRDGSATVAPRHGIEPAGEVDTLRGVLADWLGPHPVLYGRKSGAGRADWHLLEAGEAVNLTAGLTAPEGRIAAVSREGLLLFGDEALWSAGRDRLRRVSPPGLRLRSVAIGDIEAAFRLRASSPPRQDRAAGAGPDGEIHEVGLDGTVRGLASGGRPLAAGAGAALTLERRGLAETLVLGRAQGTRAVDAVNERLASVALTRPDPVAHRDVFGRPTESRLFLPGGCEAAAARGLVVDLYPGSVDAGEWSGPLSLTYGLRAAVLAGAGYAVLSPSLPVDRPEARSAELWAAGLDAAVDAALAACPALDPDRIAVVGHSYGATVALQIATVSSRYRSYVAWAGTSLTLSKWGEFIPATRALAADGHMMRNQQGWIETGQGGPSGRPWSDTATYVADSPFLAADRIRAPVLLITSDRDYVPMSQAELMFSALYRLGGRARLIEYWGEDHSLWSPANIRDLYAQVFAWLEETTGGDVRSHDAGTTGAAGGRPPE